MAKKRSAGGFNMAEETRQLLREDPTMTGKQVYEALQKKFPNRKLNQNSLGVAFTSARKKLGITPKKKRRKSAKKIVRRKKPAANTQTANLSALKAAAKYIAEVGDSDRAIEAIKQLQSLQIR